MATKRLPRSDMSNVVCWLRQHDLRAESVQKTVDRYNPGFGDFPQHFPALNPKRLSEGVLSSSPSAKLRILLPTMTSNLCVLSTQLRRYRLCRKFCFGGREVAVAPVGGRLRRPGSRTVRPQ